MSLNNDWLAFVVTLVTAGLVVEAIKYTARKQWLSSAVSRKFMHIVIGPVFVLLWPLFSSQPRAAYFAAAVPACITANFVAVGTGLLRDEATVRSMSRSGDRRELLRGPLAYGIVFVLATIMYWRQLTGITALMILCGGDGFAALAGAGATLKLPWSSHKTWRGSIACFVASLTLSLLFAQYSHQHGWSEHNALSYAPRAALLAAIATAVESLPVPWDNATVFLAVVLADAAIL